MNKQHENAFIRQIMDSTNGVQRATANPYLLTVLNQKIEQQPKNNWEYLSAYLTKPAIWVSAILLVILLNSAVLWMSANSTTAADATIVVSNEDAAESFAIIDQTEIQEP
jgi:hypothetical protein